jgi:hypothetical protein
LEMLALVLTRLAFELAVFVWQPIDNPTDANKTDKTIGFKLNFFDILDSPSLS